MPKPKPVSGVFAAVGTPRHTDGKLDLATFEKSLEFLMNQGIRGFAVNGATGEYCLTTPEELKAVVAATAAKTDGRATFVCGIGSAGLSGCLQNAGVAQKEGAPALLLPMPHFFPYAQCDLDVFCRAVAARVEVPTLLYNLPFSSKLKPETAVGLMETCPQIAGIKDSSGSLEILMAMTTGKVDALRIVGSDGVLSEALSRQCCDGVISGVASVAPELILSVWNEAMTKQPGNKPAEKRAANLLDEFIQAINVFPVPWGLKLIGEFRGIAPASFAQPLAAERQPQIARLREWWLPWKEARDRESGEKVA